MTIQFICRGNVFRSIIAETYLRSLELPDVTVFSTGTVASEHKDKNRSSFPLVLAVLERHGLAQYAKDHYGGDTTQEKLDRSDVAIFMSNMVYEEAMERFTLPETSYVWQVHDIDEFGLTPATEDEVKQFIDHAFDEIVRNVTLFVATATISLSDGAYSKK